MDAQKLDLDNLKIHVVKIILNPSESLILEGSLHVRSKEDFEEITLCTSPFPPGIFICVSQINIIIRESSERMR